MAVEELEGEDDAEEVTGVEEDESVMEGDRIKGMTPEAIKLLNDEEIAAFSDEEVDRMLDILGDSGEIEIAENTALGRRIANKAEGNK